MNDHDYGERIRALEIAFPYIQRELSEHRTATAAFHQESVNARKETNQKIDTLAEIITTRQIQEKTAMTIGKVVLDFVKMVVAAFVAIGTILGGFVSVGGLKWLAAFIPK
jgi:predicted phage tail protein